MRVGGKDAPDSMSTASRSRQADVSLDDQSTDMGTMPGITGHRQNACMCRLYFAMSPQGGKHNLAHHFLPAGLWPIKLHPPQIGLRMNRHWLEQLFHHRA